MLIFFRKIRQRLLRENRITRYLFYAAGEIILVVIGILIALQINNWNNDRKDLKLEQQILQDIRSSLQSDLDNVWKTHVDRVQQDLKHTIGILNTMEQNLPFHDSLSDNFRALTYSFDIQWEVTSYKALESEGFKVINNVHLKKAILKLYNHSYPEIRNNVENFSNNLVQYYRPYMRNHFRFDYRDTSRPVYVPIDYASVAEDPQFHNILQTARLNYTNINNGLGLLTEEVMLLIELIDQELKGT